MNKKQVAELLAVLMRLAIATEKQVKLSTRAIKKSEVLMNKVAKFQEEMAKDL